jgi:hypothetical protein
MTGRYFIACSIVLLTACESSGPSGPCRDAWAVRAQMEKAGPAQTIQDAKGRVDNDQRVLRCNETNGRDWQ